MAATQLSGIPAAAGIRVPAVLLPRLGRLALRAPAARRPTCALAALPERRAAVSRYRDDQ